MRRIWERTFEEQIQYHLDDGRAPIFEEGQPDRVRKAREYVANLLGQVGRRAVIRELGCGSADISGPFSETNDVYGYDITPESERVVHERFPAMNFTLAPIETVQPEPCDVLILCEVLEHLYDPVPIVRSWLPLADGVVIGHPVDEPEPYVEMGHLWRYTTDDFDNWFDMGGHEMVTGVTFSMGPFPGMILGYGRRKGSA